MNRRLLSLLALCVLLATPLGHTGAGAHGAVTAMAAHCHNSPATSGKADRAAIDCTIACAAIAPAGLSPESPMPAAPTRPQQLALPAFQGVAPEADPPPPRMT